MKKESDIQKAVINLLSTIPDIFFFSIPNEGFMQSAMMGKMDKKTMAIMTRHLKKMGMVSGVPDICILYKDVDGFIPENEPGNNDPKTLFIELKTETGKVSKVQKIIHEKIRSIGHDVEVAYSFADVKHYLMTYGILKGVER